MEIDTTFFRLEDLIFKDVNSFYFDCIDLYSQYSPNGIFEELRKLILKPAWISKGPKRQSYLEEEEKAGGSALFYIEACS